MSHELVDVRPGLEAVRARVARLARSRGPRVSDFIDKVQDVVIIASSSRGGSSVFSETLRASPDLLHLQAELNPLLTLARLHPLDTGGIDDHIPPGTPFDRDVLDRELAFDAGHRQAGPVDLDRWASDLCWRLLVQWTAVDWEPDEVRDWLGSAWTDVLGDRSPRAGLPDGALSAIHLAFIARARSRSARVDPRMWDLDTSSLPAGFSELPALTEAPVGAIIEEPPFVTVGPWVRAMNGLDRPLVIKTPSNAYRLAFLKALFRKARFRVLHLTRNPAASINGLVDGWTYRGFHAHPVAPPLDIEGYGDQRPDDRGCWKYDLAPGWRTVAHRPLVEVAAHQWVSAHRHVLGFLRAHPEVETTRVRFEDVVGTQAVRRQTLEQVMDWLGAPIAPAFARVIEEPLDPVMATVRPRARRWFARAERLAPALRLEPVRQVARELGYEERSSWV